MKQCLKKIPESVTKYLGNLTIPAFIFEVDEKKVVGTINIGQHGKYKQDDGKVIF